MQILGMIVEYNPFHNGHLYHINQSIKKTGAEYVIAVMSGSFVQRGDPAIIDKWTRAKMALLCGVDLVIELPVFYSLQSAELFAHYGVKLLDATGVVSNISFGSESGSIERLITTSNILSFESEDFKETLKNFLNEGHSFPTAREKVLKLLYNLNEINQPNNILAVEYLKALKRINSKIKPYTIKRKGSGYHDKVLSKEIASATAIREHIHTKMLDGAVKNYIPESVFRLLDDYFSKGNKPVSREDYFPYIKYRLTTITQKRLKTFMDVEDGLQNRILSAAKEAKSLEELILLIKTKRYTYTRISRILFRVLLDYKGIPPSPSYIRILGFNEKGRKILREMKKRSLLPIIIKPSQLKGNKDFQIELRATNVYVLPMGLPSNLDFINGPVII